MSKGFPSLDERRALCSERVTLNGQLAAIGGALLGFATVRTLDCKVGAEWSWPTVVRVVAAGGRFSL